MIRDVTPRIITATAPVRICDNGGWTDTWVARRGQVFNIAVRPLVTVRLEVFPRGARDARVILNVENYGIRYAPSIDDPTWGPHPLLEATLRAVPPPPDADIEATIGSDAPAGASTGTSAAVVVALLGALDRLIGRGRSSIQIAEEAHAVETKWLGRQCGVQDQLCAAFGGINFIEIVEYPRAVVNRLDLPIETLTELDRRLSLVYLGRPHSSAAVHETVTRDLERLGPDYEPLNALRLAAAKARDAVLAGDLQALGRSMRDNTDAQTALHSDLVHPDARRVIEIAAEHGAVGWKINGAGGDGGSVTVLASARDAEGRAMIEAIQQDNPACVPIPIALSRDGLRVWEH
jgi:D-glycero-alpha-D-manno-heptose-7-phosphate kinase